MEHHLIAHSHGGNVVLYALRDHSISDRIESVVCLATPFIHARARPVEPAFQVLRVLITSMALAPGIILTLLSFLFAVLVTQALPDSPFAKILHNAGLPSPLLLAGLVGLCGFLIWGGLRTSRHFNPWLVSLLRPRIERYQQKLVNDYHHCTPRPVPLLNAQVERDEPAFWLRALRWMSEPQGNSRTVIMIAAAFVLLFGGSFVWKFIYDPSIKGSLLSIMLLATYTVVCMVLVWLFMLVLGYGVFHLICVAFPLLVRAHGLGFGKWSIIANWLVLIEARTVPAGDYRIESFRIATQG